MELFSKLDEDGSGELELGELKQMKKTLSSMEAAEDVKLDEDATLAVQELEAAASARGTRLLEDVRHRLRYLADVGLEYLSLSRQARTLSGGEAQRIHLASALGASLTETLYCLDEPTVGLHARDSERLLGVLGRLTAAGNTVVLVEHDPVLIEGSDYLIDLGPGGGSEGGQIVFAGPPGNLNAESSETGRLLVDRRVERQA